MAEKASKISDDQLRRIRFENQVERSLRIALEEVRIEPALRENLSAEEALFLARKLAIYCVHPQYR